MAGAKGIISTECHLIKSNNYHHDHDDLIMIVITYKTKNWRQNFVNAFVVFLNHCEKFAQKIGSMTTRFISHKQLV